MAAPQSFREKSPGEIRGELAGFPQGAVDAAMLFREHGTPEQMDALVLAVIAFYLPADRAKELGALPPETRLREDLGADSLTLTEMVFKLDELIGVPIEIRDAAQIQTIGELHAFLRRTFAS